MIFKHKYLSETFLNNKSIQKVTQDKPIVLVLSKKFTLLNEFTRYALRINKIKFELK